MFQSELWVLNPNKLTGTLPCKGSFLKGNHPKLKLSQDFRLSCCCIQLLLRSLAFVNLTNMNHFRSSPSNFDWWTGETPRFGMKLSPLLGISQAEAAPKLALWWEGGNWRKIGCVQSSLNNDHELHGIYLPWIYNSEGISCSRINH